MKDDGAPAGRTRMHNSGPGAREIFRCPPIGAGRHVDLAHVLSAWADVSWEITQLQAVHTTLALLASTPITTFISGVTSSKSRMVPCSDTACRRCTAKA